MSRQNASSDSRFSVRVFARLIKAPGFHLGRARASCRLALGLGGQTNHRVVQLGKKTRLFSFPPRPNAKARTEKCLPKNLLPGQEGSNRNSAVFLMTPRTFGGQSGEEKTNRLQATPMELFQKKNLA